jgi:hypothetical protein
MKLMSLFARFRLARKPAETEDPFQKRLGNMARRVPTALPRSGQTVFRLQH